MNSLEIFVITRDRPRYLCQALLSIFAQRRALLNISHKIVVSDNSISDISVNPVEFMDGVEIRRRSGTLSAVEHLNVVLSEVTADFFLMLHDDDLLATNYFSTTIPILRRDPKISAVAVNGYCFIEENMKLRSTSVCRVALPESLNLVRYFKRVLNHLDVGIPPVSGFLFSKLASSLRFDPAEGGKHCDVSFIGKVISIGKVVQLQEPLIYVREHASNDSNIEVYENRMKLMRHIARAISLNSKSWPFLLYRWRCSGQALTARSGHYVNFSRIHSITSSSNVLGIIHSWRYLAIRFVDKVMLRLQLKRHRVEFESTYFLCSALPECLDNGSAE